MPHAAWELLYRFSPHWFGPLTKKYIKYTKGHFMYFWDVIGTNNIPHPSNMYTTYFIYLPKLFLKYWYIGSKIKFYSAFIDQNWLTFRNQAWKNRTIIEQCVEIVTKILKK